MFKLNIECTKDFDELHIIFSDGTNTVVTNGRKEINNNVKETVQNKKPQAKSLQRNKPSEDLLDTDAEWGGVSQEVVQKPSIDDRQRPVKVAEELQNLDI